MSLKEARKNRVAANRMDAGWQRGWGRAAVENVAASQSDVLKRDREGTWVISGCGFSKRLTLGGGGEIGCNAGYLVLKVM